MTVAALILIVVGLFCAVFGGVKFRQYTEWEHWAEKLKWLLASIIGMAAAGVGGLALFFSLQL